MGQTVPLNGQFDQYIIWSFVHHVDWFNVF